MSLLSLPSLASGDAKLFREQCLQPEKPGFFPSKSIELLPAMKMWFMLGASPSERGAVGAPLRLNHDYLESFGDVPVPLEFTSFSDEAGEADAAKFTRMDAPLRMFLMWTRHRSPNATENMYLAQCSISRLPTALQRDLPTPKLVRSSGKGDVYDANIWIGLPPTYTPLHRDPNPNLFLQMAGQKRVRLCSPETGEEIFRAVQARLGQQSSSSRVRGDEMMEGAERQLLEAAVWPEQEHEITRSSHIYEVELHRGEAIFIPKGWWHSLKGFGEGITASANWWFR